MVGVVDRASGPHLAAWPGVELAFRQALALPLHSQFTDADLDRVVAGVARFA